MNRLDLACENAHADDNNSCVFRVLYYTYELTRMLQIVYVTVRVLLLLFFYCIIVVVVAVIIIIIIKLLLMRCIIVIIDYTIPSAPKIVTKRGADCHQRNVPEKKTIVSTFKTYFIHPFIIFCISGSFFII